MKKLIASNGEIITLEDEHAEFFLSKHKEGNPYGMKWVDLESEEGLAIFFDKLQEEVSKNDLPLWVEREGSVLNTIMKGVKK